MKCLIVDRRPHGVDAAEANVTRWLDKYKHHVKNNINKKIRTKKLADKVNKVTLYLADGLYMPMEEHSIGDIYWVTVANDRWVAGDKIDKPPYDLMQMLAGGGEDQESAHEVTLDDKEFLDTYFEGWSLPNFIKTALTTTEKSYERGGYTTSGSPATLDLQKTYKFSLQRRAALLCQKESEIEELEEELRGCKDKDRIKVIKIKLKELEEYTPPFIDDKDVRYRHKYLIETSIKKAVIVFVLDVAASIDKNRLFLAKKSFQLLFWFLLKVYGNNVELRFVQYTMEAREVDEEEFFKNKRTGGTEIYSGLKLAQDIIKEEQYTQYNKYVFHASDGDTWGEDINNCDVLLNSLLPALQYYIFIGTDLNHFPDNFYKYIEDKSQDSDKIGTVLINNDEDVQINIKELFKDS